MGGFTEQFSVAVRAAGAEFRAALGGDAQTEVEAALAERAEAQWCELPPPATADRPVLAVDGASASRQFDHGWTMLVAHALAVGLAEPETATAVRFVRSTVPGAVVQRLGGLLRRLLELKVALAAARRGPDAVVCIDGSLHTDLPHLIYPLAVPGEEGLPAELVGCYADLFRLARRQRVTIVAVSKSSSATFFGEALWRLGDDAIGIDAAAAADPALPEVPTDAETLRRFLPGGGYTRPLLLGNHGFGRRGPPLVHSAQGAEASVPELVDMLRTLPATVAWHQRPRAGEAPLRIDVPATCLGRSERVVDVYMRWLPPEAVREVAGWVAGWYGGRQVYHAPLYVADRLVRLANDTVDGPYLAIVRDFVGRAVEYERGRRRFL